MIAGIHAKAIEQIESAVLVGVADVHVEAAERFAQTHGVALYQSYEDMLADPDLDVICICTPSGFHAQNALAALKQGKHVVLEKPMALSLEDANEIVATCDQTGKLLTVISQLRFSEDVRKVKHLLEENAFGKISLCSLYMKYYRSVEYYASSSWKGTRKYDGGGALMNQGIHGVDLLEYIVGSVKEVTGKVKTLSHKIEVEDTAVAMVEFENGALGVIEASTCAYPGFERRLEIHGDRGYVLLKNDQIEELMVNGEEVLVDTSGSRGSTANDPANLHCEMHRRQIQNLLAAICGEEQLLVDAREGRKAIRLIEAIYQA